MFHILNPLPDLLIYSLWAPLILRVTVGYFFVNFGIFKFKEGSWKTLGVVEFIIGICFVFGLAVQIDAIVSILILLGMIFYYEKVNIPRKQSRECYWLLLLISLSLLLSGAGLPAIDLPL